HSARRRHYGGETHLGARPAVPSPADLESVDRFRGRGRASAHHRLCHHSGSHRSRNGGADRSQRGRAHALRHDESGRQARRDHSRARAVEVGRQERRLAGAVTAESGAGAQAAPAGAGEGARSATVIVASTSAAAGKNADRTGPVIVEWLRERGFVVSEPVVTADGPPVGAALREALGAGARVVITTGGTGVSPSDLTPEQTLPLIDVSL